MSDFDDSVRAAVVPVELAEQPDLTAIRRTMGMVLLVLLTIGFYFAKLWYFERLYPQVWTVGALGKVAALGPY